MKKSAAVFLILSMWLGLLLRVAFPTVALHLGEAVADVVDPSRSYTRAVEAMGSGLVEYGLHKTITFAFKNIEDGKFIPVSKAGFGGTRD